jgi:hypothetical protein
MFKGRKSQPSEVEQPSPQPQAQSQSEGQQSQPQQQQQQAQPEDIEKSITDVENQLKVAWNDDRKKHLESELDRLKIAQEAQQTAKK